MSEPLRGPPDRAPPRDPGPFEHTFPVPYGAVDWARIVYYPQVLHFCHLTKEAMFPAVFGYPYAELMERLNTGFPTVRTEADFLRPVSYGQDLRMVLSVEKLGGSTVHFRYEGYRSRDRQLAFVVRNVEVAVDLEAWCSRPLTREQRKCFGSLVRPAPGGEAAGT